MSTAVRRCKDCPPGTKRKASHPGPRCATCHRAVRAARRQAAREKRVEQTYGITEEQYQAIYEFQGRRCYICQRARGTGKYRLAVDHDHSCCDGPVSCGKCVRGLLCRSCNRDFLGHARDELAMFDRAKEYLTNPPAHKVLGIREEI